jgi:hypothetical protein
MRCSRRRSGHNPSAKDPQNRSLIAAAVQREEKEQVPLHPSDACAVLPQGNLAACPSAALSNVRTSSIPDRTCPNSNFASAMMMPRAAAISRPAFVDRVRHQLQLEIA